MSYPTRTTVVTGAALLIVVAIGSSLLGFPRWNTGNSNSIRMTIDRGINAEHRAVLEKKITELKEKIGSSRDISVFTLWLELGTTHYILGDLAQARDAFTIAADINTINPTAQGNLADTLAEMGDLKGADAAYRKAIELYPDVSYFQKYATFVRQAYPERPGSYEAVLKTGIQQLGQQSELISDLARFYEEQGRLIDAKTHYEVLVRLVPDNENAKKDLARVEAEIAKQGQ